MGTRGYDSTVARIAGNIASGLVARGTYDGDPGRLAERAVEFARLIVDETKRTEPTPPPCTRCKGTGKLYAQGDLLDCPDCGGVQR